MCALRRPTPEPARPTLAELAAIHRAWHENPSYDVRDDDPCPLLPVPNRDERPARTAMSDEAVEWMATGEQGLSSKTMFNHLVLGRVGRIDYPHDVDDFRRCELLRRAVPEVRAGLARMAELGPYWTTLVDHWVEIMAAADIDLPGIFDPDLRVYGRTETAWALMDSLLDKVRETDPAYHRSYVRSES